MESQMLSLPIAQAHFPNPFYNGLEFNAPVRGPWNIVHMALAVPESHLLYICARGCLRGVLMTAAEMGALERMSWIGVREEDLAAGLLEQTTLASAKAILAKLTPKPPLVFVYLSCIHKFAQIDYDFILEELKKAFPEIRCIGCHMMPTMRKSGPTDEERTRAKIYEAVSCCPNKDPKHVTILGNDWPLQKDSLLFSMLDTAGYTLHELPTCQNFADYQSLGKSAYYLTTHAAALFCAQQYVQRCGGIHIHAPISFTFETIEKTLTDLAKHLSLDLPNLLDAKEKAHASLCRAQKILGERPITLDYTFTARPLNLALLLLRYGFAVQGVFLDSISPFEEEDFLALTKDFPNLALYQTLAPQLRRESFRNLQCPQNDTVLALGQKAAYFCATNFFVNSVADAGLYDFSGICTLANRMLEAHSHAKDRRRCIQHKGFGLPSCVCL